MHNCVVMGVAGGSGSGKTTVTQGLIERFGESEVRIVEQDYYYKDLRHLPIETRSQINYDHPDAFDNDLLVSHIKSLVRGEGVERPNYDFTHHLRKPETTRLEPAHVLIVEGILILEDRPLRDLMEVKVFVDTDADVRVIRRIKRDMRERGRSLEAVMNQYLQTVRPMHLRFVEPSKRHADVIVPEGGFNRVAMDMLTSRIEFILRKAGIRQGV